MTIFELHDHAAGRRPFPDFLAGPRRLVALIARFRRRYETLRSIARLDAEQLRDIGLDPDDVAEARNGCGEMLWAKLHDHD